MHDPKVVLLQEAGVREGVAPVQEQLALVAVELSEPYRLLLNNDSIPTDANVGLLGVVSLSQKESCSTPKGKPAFMK